MSFDPTYEPREGLTHRDADWSGINVLVVGLGVSGFAAADALAERGARVTAVSRDIKHFSRGSCGMKAAAPVCGRGATRIRCPETFDAEPRTERGLASAVSGCPRGR